MNLVFNLFFVETIIKLLSHKKHYGSIVIWLATLTDNALPEVLLKVLKSDKILSIVFDPSKAAPFDKHELVFVANIALHEDAKQYVINIDVVVMSPKDCNSLECARGTVGVAVKVTQWPDLHTTIVNLV